MLSVEEAVDSGKLCIRKGRAVHADVGMLNNDVEASSRRLDILSLFPNQFLKYKF